MAGRDWQPIMPHGASRHRKRRRQDDVPAHEASSIFVTVNGTRTRRTRSTNTNPRTPLPVIATPNNVYLTQIRPGDASRRYRPHGNGTAMHVDLPPPSGSRTSDPPSSTPAEEHASLDNAEQSEPADGGIEDAGDGTVHPSNVGQKKSRKTRDHLETQATRWRDTVLPSLLQPFLRYLERFSSVDTNSNTISRACTCNKQPRLLPILVLHFNSMYSCCSPLLHV